jgi:hypothetical protein
MPSKSRRHLLAISSLVNDVSIDPIQRQHPLTPNYQENTCDYFTQQNYYYYHSPISSCSSSPDSRQSSITEPPDLWSHSTTGMHQALNGNIIISSLSKAKRKRILPYQYNKLIQVFKSTDTPSSETRRRLADELDMTKREVQV